MEGQGTGGPNLEPRVRQLEHSVDSLHADVARVSQAVAGVSSQVTGLAKSLESFAEKLDAHRTRRPDWGVYVSLGALLLAIGAATLWPVNQRVSLIEFNQATDRQQAIQRGERIGALSSHTEHLEGQVRELREDGRRLQDQINNIKPNDGP